MSSLPRLLAVSLLALLALPGCRTSDPLSGTWGNEACYGTASTPDDIESCSTVLTFTDALEISLEAEWVSLPATADYPGCITTKLVTGQSWSTAAELDYDVLLVEGTSSATEERSGCVDSADDMAPTPTSDISIRSGEINYQVVDGTLTILTGDLEGVYAL